jgi:hypothetical protein
MILRLIFMIFDVKHIYLPLAPDRRLIHLWSRAVSYLSIKGFFILQYKIVKNAKLFTKPEQKNTNIRVDNLKE